MQYIEFTPIGFLFMLHFDLLLFCSYLHWIHDSGVLLIVQMFRPESI